MMSPTESVAISAEDDLVTRVAKDVAVSHDDTIRNEAFDDRTEQAWLQLPRQAGPNRFRTHAERIGILGVSLRDEVFDGRVHPTDSITRDVDQVVLVPERVDRVAQPSLERVELTDAETLLVVLVVQPQGHSVFFLAERLIGHSHRQYNM